MKNTLRSLVIASSVFAASANATLITNGSFEENVGLTGGQWGVFQSIPGWTATGGAGIEVERETVVSTPFGNQYVELDSHNNSSMSQYLTGLSVGSIYQLDFWFKPRTGTFGDNGINVSWGATPDISPFTYAFGVDGVAPADWALKTGFLTATSTDMTLTFSAVGINNSLGGFIDNVSLNSVAVSEPASLALFGLGLLGLGAVRRGRKA